MQSNRASWAPLVVGILAAALVQPVSAARYNLVDLGANVLPKAISGSGEVAGESAQGRAVVYRGGRWHRLSGEVSLALDIDVEGDAVGYDNGAAVLWRRGEPVMELPMPRPHDEAYAYAINGNRTVVGLYVETSTGEDRCFAWREDRGSLDLGMMGSGDYCAAQAINSAGQVAGSATSAPGGPFHAFRYDQNTGFLDLGTLPGGAWSAAASLNAKGDVAGGSNLPPDQDHEHAVVWHAGTPIDLDPHGAYRQSEALGISDRGLVVGTAQDHHRNYAVRFGPAGIVHLEDEVDGLSDWKLASAISVDNQGRIVGTGYRSDGQTRAFLLLPVGLPHAGRAGR